MTSRYLSPHLPLGYVSHRHKCERIHPLSERDVINGWPLVLDNVRSQQFSRKLSPMLLH